MIKSILVRYGDLVLKGVNKKRFIKQVLMLVREKVQAEDVTFEAVHDRLYVHLHGADPEKVMQGLRKVSGLSSFSPIMHSSRDIDTIIEDAKTLLKDKVNTPQTFRVETKRADKSFATPSMEVSKRVSSALLKMYKDTLSVDLSNPDLTLSIEIRKQGVYLYSDRYKAMGGFPVGIAGKGLLMLSGGIDSPVAGYLAMKQGVELEAIHFESTPLTSIESVQKTIDLVKKLSVYAPKSTIKLHLVPFTSLHQAMLENVPDPYQITIMRRMMYRIADQFAELDHIPILVNGESIGQVASQTLESIKVVNEVTHRPVIRPLATIDKNDIVNLARTIDTYSVSIRPFEDCCTLYTPNQPTTNPRSMYAVRYERLFDYKTLIDEAVQSIKTLTITSTSSMDLTRHGLTVKEALNGGENHDHKSE